MNWNQSTAPADPMLPEAESPTVMEMMLEMVAVAVATEVVVGEDEMVAEVVDAHANEGSSAASMMKPSVERGFLTNGQPPVRYRLWPGFSPEWFRSFA